MAISLDEVVQQASSDVHSTLQQAQTTLAGASESLARVNATIENVNALVAKLTAAVDVLTDALKEAKVVETDADDKIKAVKLPWPLR